MSIIDITDKLKDILSNEIPNKKIFDKDVANALNLSKESFSIMKKKDSIPYEQISKFCAKRKISINWVLFDQMPKSLEEETEKYTKIKYFNKINASAGGGSFNYDENFESLVIDKNLLDSLYKSNKSNMTSIIALNVIGDSMEPTLFNEDIVLIDCSNKDIESNEIFVISTNIGLFIKRLFLKADGSLELISDNKNYDNEIITIDEINSIKIIGNVLGKVSYI